MKLETKFNVDDLVGHKFNRIRPSKLVCYRVMEVVTQTCYGGTQVFYDCRMIIASKQFEGFKEKGPFTWEVEHAVRAEGHERACGTFRYREDEVIDLTQEQKDIFSGKITDGIDEPNEVKK